MKYLITASLNIKRFFTFIFTVLVTVIVGIASAEDIEIYRGSLDDGTAATTSALVNPNVLFIMDTSGSMGTVEPTPATLGSYDPDTDYGADGDADDDDYIYVYDENLQYTGHYVTADQNKCNTMSTFHAANPGYPLYLDRGLQWQDGQVETTEPVCTTTGGIDDTGNGQHGFQGWEKIYQKDLTTPGGYPYSISVTVDLRSRFYVYVSTTTSSSVYVCQRNMRGSSSNPQTKTCSGTLPSNTTQVRVWLENRRSGTNDYSYDVEIDDGSETCTDVPTTTRVTEWNEDIETSTDNDWVLECANDAGEHGINSSSTQRYPRWCGNGNICGSPAYTSSTANDINYSSAGIDQKFFVTGNYHDYIQSFSHPNPSSLSTENANTYCNSFTEGNVFIDSNTQVIMTCLKRLDIMKQALSNLVNSTSNINAGLMRFNSNGEGGTVIDAVDDLNVEATKTSLLTKISGLNASGSTPLSESLYEAYRYYAGLTKDYGYSAGTSNTSTDLAAMDGSSYITPMLNHCQNNNAVLLTDGVPYGDSSANSEIGSLNGGSCAGSGDGAVLR